MVGLPCGLLQGDTAGGGRGSALQPGSVPVGRALQAWSLIRTPILISSAPLITMQPADGIWCVDGLLSPSCSGAHSINVTHGQMFLFLGKNNL